MTVIVNINYHSLNVVFAIKIVIIVYLGEGEGNAAQGWFVLFASSTRLYMQAGARRGTHTIGWVCKTPTNYTIWVDAKRLHTHTE